MPRLESPRHEKFCHNIANGMSGAAAYRKVYGGDISGAKQCASELLTKVDLRDRVKELQLAAESKLVLSMQERREIIAKRSRAKNVTDGALAAFLHLDAKLAGDLTERTETVHLGDPSAPLIVQLPTIITTPRPRKQPQQPA